MLDVKSPRTATLASAVKASTSETERITALLELAAHLDLVNRTTDAMDAINEACTRSLSLGDAVLQGWAFHRRMVINGNAGQFDAGQIDGVMALDAFQRAGHLIGQLRALSGRADALLRLENLDEGYRVLIEATVLADSLTDIDVELMNAQFLLGDAYAAIALFDDAIARVEMGRAMAAKLDDPAEVLWGDYRMADTLVDAAEALAGADGALASDYYRRAEQVLLGIDPRAAADSEFGLQSLLSMLRGITEVGCGRPEDAVETLRETQALGRSIEQSPLEFGRTASGLGRALHALGHHAEARAQFDAAITAFANTESVTRLASALTDRSAVNEAVGDLSAALDDARRAVAVRESQRLRETHRRADTVRAGLEVERSRIDLQRRELVADELQRLAGEDSLTGLSNRRTLDSEGSAIVELCGNGLVSVAVIDIDDFKTINDRHSHLVGDAVLRQVAELLTAETRPGDLVARYAGDEFVIILPGLDADRADGVRQRVREAIDRTQWTDIAARLQVTATMGLASGFGSDGLWALFARADADLYDAKATRTGGHTPSVS